MIHKHEKLSTGVLSVSLDKARRLGANSTDIVLARRHLSSVPAAAPGLWTSADAEE